MQSMSSHELSNPIYIQVALSMQRIPRDCIEMVRENAQFWKESNCNFTTMNTFPLPQFAGQRAKRKNEAFSAESNWPSLPAETARIEPPLTQMTQTGLDLIPEALRAVQVTHSMHGDFYFFFAGLTFLPRRWAEQNVSSAFACDISNTISFRSPMGTGFKVQGLEKCIPQFPIKNLFGSDFFFCETCTAVQVGPALSEHAKIKIGLYPKYSQNHTPSLSCVNMLA